MRLSSLTFKPIGGGSEIGANSYLLGFEGHTLLLDCGVHPKKEGVTALPDFSLIDEAPEAALISHGHIDHCGALPYLGRLYPETIPYMTLPTIKIVDRMLHNSVSVMGTLALERGISDYPLYTHAEVDEVLRRGYAMPFSHEFAPAWNSPFRAQFFPSGHVLGSACISMKVPGHSLLYTGDICMTHQELLGGYEGFPGDREIDTVIVECTRGAQPPEERRAYEDEIGRLSREISSVLKMNGCVLLPAFALGRTQEMLNIIARLQEWGKIPDVPVYASGLGRAVYEIYARCAEYLRPGATMRPLSEFYRIGDVWERAVVRELLKKPCIIVATSGMMLENTPSAMIAQEMVRSDKHGIFFIGYVDPDTPGYRVLHAQPGESVAFELGSRPTPIEMTNRKKFDFSAHAPREDLCAMLEAIAPRNVVLVHGDPEAIAWMQANCPIPCRIAAPQLGDTVELEA